MVTNAIHTILRHKYLQPIFSEEKPESEGELGTQQKLEPEASTQQELTGNFFISSFITQWIYSKQTTKNI